MRISPLGTESTFEFVGSYRRGSDTMGDIDIIIMEDKKFDLVYSTEFFEHVDKIYMDNFLCLFKNAKYAFVSAAPPGQGGHHHVNEQPKQFWIDALKEYGLKYLPEDSEEISNTNDSNLVRKNSMFFINENFYIYIYNLLFNFLQL